ncbi:MAG: pyridoxamine 5'-phosphate oxidase family protein, partial [Pseudomonadota bacterium]
MQYEGGLEITIKLPPLCAFEVGIKHETAKGRELDGNLQAALVLHWKSLNRQLRVRGPVETVAAKQA